MVYGEHDKYVAKGLWEKTIEKINDKKQPYMILPGQDHSPWDFDVAQQVYKEEIRFLSQYLK